MSKFFPLFLMLMLSTASAAEWKKVAEARNCNGPVTVIAKEGEKYVKVGDIKLHSISNTGFSISDPKENVFKGDHFEFTQPGMTQRKDPNLKVNSKTTNLNCHMNSVQ